MKKQTSLSKFFTQKTSVSTLTFEENKNAGNNNTPAALIPVAAVASSSNILVPISIPGMQLELQSEHSDITITRRPADITDISQAPNQPKKYNFPSIQFGKSKRSFQSAWFKDFPWLHWQEESASVVCHTCIRAIALNLNILPSGENAFLNLSVGFQNWKKAIERFKVHEHSEFHRTCSLKVHHFFHGTSIATQLDEQKGKEKENAQEALMKILSTVRFLARQGLPLRGHIDENSNLIQLLKVRCEDCTVLKEWMLRKEKWLGHDIQNEFLEIFSHHILQNIVTDIKGNDYFSLLVDETSDVSRDEQVSICIRHVDNMFIIHEDFVGFYNVESTDAATLTKVIKDVIIRLGLSLENCFGQCYDGAANMSGIFKGVQARLKSEYPLMIYTHCFAHSLNLVLQQSARCVTIVRDALDLVMEVTNFIRDSPKRLARFKHIKNNDSPTLKPLCPTRWTVRAKSIKALIQSLQPAIDELIEISESDMGTAGSKANGLYTNLKQYKSIFGLLMCLHVFELCEGVSETLQSSSISVQGGLKAVNICIETLKSMRSNDNEFEKIWNEAEKIADQVEASPPTLPRKRKIPKRLDDGMNVHEHVTAKDLYRIDFWYPFIDVIISEMQRRFHQSDQKISEIIEIILTKASQRISLSIEDISQLNMYSKIIDLTKLKAQLIMLPEALINHGGCVKICDIIQDINQLGDGSRLLGEVKKLLKLYLVFPVTTATSERSFSGLRRLKTYLRSTMSQPRLTHLALLNAHQHRTDLINIQDTARTFISRSSNRKNTFGKI